MSCIYCTIAINVDTSVYTRTATPDLLAPPPRHVDETPGNRAIDAKTHEQCSQKHNTTTSPQVCVASPARPPRTRHPAKGERFAKPAPRASFHTAKRARDARPPAAVRPSAIVPDQIRVLRRVRRLESLNLDIVVV